MKLLIHGPERKHPQSGWPLAPSGQLGIPSQPLSFPLHSGPTLFPYLVPPPCTYPKSSCPVAEGWPHPMFAWCQCLVSWRPPSHRCGVEAGGMFSSSRPQPVLPTEHRAKAISLRVSGNKDDSCLREKGPRLAYFPTKPPQYHYQSRVSIYLHLLFLCKTSEVPNTKD